MASVRRRSHNRNKDGRSEDNGRFGESLECGDGPGNREREPRNNHENGNGSLGTVLDAGLQYIPPKREPLDR